jgi:hypothetical protein
MLRAQTRYAFRRSRLRERLCDHLRRRGRVDAHQLKLALGMTSTRFREVLFGGTDDYRAEESLVALGLIRVVAQPCGLALELTSRGVAEVDRVRELRVSDVPV